MVHASAAQMLTFADLDSYRANHNPHVSLATPMGLGHHVFHATITDRGSHISNTATRQDPIQLAYHGCCYIYMFLINPVALRIDQCSAAWFCWKIWECPPDGCRLASDAVAVADPHSRGARMVNTAM